MAFPPPANTRKHLDPHQHTRFTIRVAPDQAVPTDLVAIECLPPGAQAARKPFRLLFRATDARALPQRTYTVAHEEVGDLDIVLVPLGPVDGRMTYEAIFN